jgi:hypothetical protein
VTCAGKLRLRLIDAKLREHLVDVGIGLDVEVDEELDHAVVGADRVHVDHVVDAVHLLLDRRRNGLRDGLGVGAGIGGGDQNLRRNNVGNCEVGSVNSDTVPRITVRMAITMATMGRRIKNFDIDYLPPRCCLSVGEPQGRGAG